jgi:tRNA dimethylallyltransferase
LTPPLVILGPTASGKSDLAMAWATRTPGAHIVAVDAMQVYRRMDIGTAKPSPADRARVAHHCLDLVEPADEFTLTQHTAEATAALDRIGSEGGSAVLVAGTGLYLRALTDPMEVPGRWPDVRATLEQRLTEEGPQALHAELARVDARAAERMEPSNARRVVRALEVTIGGGRPFSTYGPGLDVYPPVPFTQIGLSWPRPLLSARIAGRVEQMLAAGLLAEVEALAAGPISRTARQALGYKELFDHLAGECSLDEAVATVIARTRRYAVRQIRWFRRDPRIRWIAVEHDPVAEALPVLEELPGA